MKIKIPIVVMCCFFVLAACEPSPPVQRVQTIPTPNYLLDDLKKNNVAFWLDDNCRSVKFDRAAGDQQNLEMRNRLDADGINLIETVLMVINRTPSQQADIQSHLFSYIEENGILVGQNATVCRAAKKEIATKSRIGLLLGAG